jgi:hypothetical protein
VHASSADSQQFANGLAPLDHITTKMIGAMTLSTLFVPLS